MKLFVASTILTASTILGATFAAAEGHATKQLVVPASVCPEMIQQMVQWSQSRGEYTVYAVPTTKTPGTCGEPGPLVTAGIGSSPKVSDARKAALGVCNDARGDLGRCVVVGTLRFKE